MHSAISYSKINRLLFYIFIHAEGHIGVVLICSSSGNSLVVVDQTCLVYAIYFLGFGQVMRRNLLKLVRVREFAPEAEFQNLRTSLTLPNVICR